MGTGDPQRPTEAGMASWWKCNRIASENRLRVLKGGGWEFSIMHRELLGTQR